MKNTATIQQIDHLTWEEEESSLLNRLALARNCGEAIEILAPNIQRELPYQGINILILTVPEKKNKFESYRGRIVYEKVDNVTFPWQDQFNWEDEEKLMPIAYQLSQMVEQISAMPGQLLFQWIDDIPFFFKDYLNYIASEFPRLEYGIKVKDFFRTSKWGRKIDPLFFGYPLYVIHPLTAQLSHLLQIILPAHSGRIFIINFFFKDALIEEPKILLNRLRYELLSFQSFLYKTVELDIFRHAKNQLVNQALKNMLNLLFNAIKARDHETGMHQARIQLKGKIFLKYLFSGNFKGVFVAEREKSVIYRLGINNVSDLFRLHDIGKIGIPDHILHNSLKLNDEDYAIMKSHVTIGVDMILEALRSVSDASDDITLLYQTLVDIIWSHHEGYDGQGYPLGLKGKEISLLGRIMTLIDSQDAIRHRRVYKEEYSPEQVTAIILQERGKKFDPDLVDIYLLHLQERFERLDLRYKD